MEKQLNVVSIRLVEDRPLMSDLPITTPLDAVKLLGDHLCELDREVLCVINIRSDGKPMNCNFVSMGAVNESIAHPREIFKSAILANATSMIIMHNHPSGKLEPSRQDTNVTDRILKLCEILGIPLLDSIIVGGKNDDYFSFKEKQLLDFEHNKYESDYKKLEFPTSRVAEDSLNDENESEGQVPVRRRRGR